MLAAAPLMPLPSVTLILYVTPASTLAVKEIDALPLAKVTEETGLMPAPVLASIQVRVRPAIAIGLSSASRSCAVSTI
jgi:hypothetical protein